jgi:phospholipase/carboxylesterase
MAGTDLVVRMVGKPPPAVTTTVVLMHGFGAGGDDLVPLARELGPLPAARFLFPEAPLTVDPSGGGRAWWLLDMERIQRMMASGRDERSVDEIPEGLDEARALIDGMLDQVAADGTKRIVLGGFSQGAMLALDVALHRKEPLAGLALMSTTHINGAAWRERLDRVKGVPVFMSHGTRDPLLPFETARDLRDLLAGAGADLDWVEFPGGHEIPRPALAGLARLITRVAAGT